MDESGDLPRFQSAPADFSAEIAPAFHEKLMEIAPAFHEKLVDSLFDGVYFVDKERRILYWNKGAEYLTGYASSEAIGRHCFDNFLEHVNEEGCALCMGGCPLATTIEDGERRSAEVYLRHKQGHRVPVFVRLAPILDAAGNILGAVEVFSDLTAKKTIERRVGELEGLAFRDPLTEVSNRRYIEMKVGQALQEFEQFGRSIGLMMIDVDNFKLINDSHGHAVGDEALRAMCKTLTHNMREGDSVGRWGGEEFLVVAVDAGGDTLASFAERCRMLIAKSAIPVKDQHLRITVSLGATLMKQGDTVASAIQRADELMYRSKAAGRNRITLG